MTVTTLAPAVFPAMGTMVSLRTAAPIGEPVVERVRATFAAWEDRFSPFRPDSELSAIKNRRLDVGAASEQFRRTHAAATRWNVRTQGAFSPTAPDGTLDLNGIVKALAIHAAGVELTAAGAGDWCLNAGGDVLVSGTQAAGEPWRVGIADPDDRTSLLSSVALSGSRRAVATSGCSERGAHVWPAASVAADDDAIRFSQVTVVADDIVTADVLATAILAGGPATLTHMEHLTDIEVLAVGPDGLCWAAEVFRR